MAPKPLDRNFSIVAPAIGSGKKRDDLETFRPPRVLAEDESRFDNPYLAIMERGDEWFSRGLNPRQVGQMAVFMSGKIGITEEKLYIVAGHAEEHYEQFLARQAAQESGQGEQ